MLKRVAAVLIVGTLVAGGTMASWPSDSFAANLIELRQNRPTHNSWVKKPGPTAAPAQPSLQIKTFENGLEGFNPGLT